MKPQLLLILFVIVVFLSGCVETKNMVSSVGLSSALTSDTKQAEASMPITFILTVKNLASENARDISTQLLNLTGWRVEDALQNLDELLSGDLYKFSWVAYAPATPNKTFTPFANLFYGMETESKLTLRVYNNDYLNTLKPDEREKIRGKSALLSSVTSSETPVSLKISLQQPFILSDYSQKFPFVIEVKNAGLGQVYSDDATYLPSESEKNYFRFSYTGNASMICDFDTGDLARLIDGSKNIVCRLIATEDEVNSYADFTVSFTMSYTYLDRASMKIGVV